VQSRPLSFSETLRRAIADFGEHGFVSATQIETWLTLLRAAAERELGPESRIDDETRRLLEKLYDRLVRQGRVLEQVPGLGRYTLGMIAPDLRAELDRRILASASLIKLHRRDAIESTLRRFQGWSTSIPPGGGDLIDKREIRSAMTMDLKEFNWRRRRVNIDQGLKLTSNIADIVANGNGAIAAEWRSRGATEPNYDYRPEHLARHGRIFLIRGSWAYQQGLVRAVNGYTDDIEMVGFLPFCRCTYKYLMSPRQLPDALLTRKGQDFIASSGGRSGSAAA
jgi:hypothetical protein